ncbi:MAG: hypothetical protein ACK6A5_16175 [Flavobacteriales bacterium]|jgi:hypothetical protein
MRHLYVWRVGAGSPSEDPAQVWDQYTTFALTYGAEFDGGPNGPGIEFGIMLFTPPFACLGGCK